MNKIKILKIIILIVKILEINSDCNYITIGASKGKCSVIDKDDKTKSCCYVSVSKNGYSISFCTEIKNTKEAISAFKNAFKTNHLLEKIHVECKGNFLFINMIYLYIFYFYLLS
jgi:hypothetical protein